ncbi:RNA polymerase sigma factor [Thermoclostridium stercorarium]|uniref:RNA polymerase sigma factor n=1 Tax=Thermoclostridium stercorarium TaxID=1510 RepID=UPI002092584F|nr:RNA polymerase sigma factor [Thermoclostridium stercorarium]
MGYRSIRRLVDKYKNRLFSFLVKLTGSRHDSEEILQEVFIRAFSNINKYDDRWMFSTWIYRIAVNTYKSYMRKEKRNKTIPIDDAMVSENPAVYGNPENVYEKNERRREIISLIRNLKDKQRIPLILKYVKNCSYAEIGDILGISEEAAKMRVFRAKKTICEKYMERHGGEF